MNNLIVLQLNFSEASSGRMQQADPRCLMSQMIRRKKRHIAFAIYVGREEETK